ncbi:hypothetical protein K493DRAFT_386863 [Basidiobolus meristosporus CBS 931.73]|uniref:heme oxygenase (biliverdin-producing) n=1 Tax=Basidiobolus meristosporus CBS 931.73 TaxID=1314790 RepID=A0A1Y1YW07_9FUNG|nr:hypothetical protein K493DRAFT_386863 [Basidiobolus meristosporus CBS 931.73]|eukprot:ORY02253.1 hypothetical protein K493DRAFT_386863 [Basidiobolus meristosporus CBS 931.73]
MAPKEVEGLVNTYEDPAQCPAFQNGCPYAGLSVELANVKATEQCPAFKDGCPFTNKSPEEIKELLESIPKSHKQCPAFTSEGQVKLNVCTEGSSLFEALRELRTDLFLQEDAVILAEELKKGTHSVHRLAERSAFIKRYMKAEIDRETYKKFLVSLYFVYSALEEALQNCAGNPCVSLVHFPKELERKGSLIADLKYFGVESLQDLKPSPAVQKYCSAISDAAQSNPALLIAHSYTRYLGDLSGGQILSKRIQKSLALPGNEGTKFYSFEHIKDHKEFKELYRSRLNQVHADKTLKDQIVQEAIRSFELNINMFAEFDHVVTNPVVNGIHISNEHIELKWALICFTIDQVSLAKLMREGTHKVHRLAESSPFIKQYMRGHVTAEVYGRFLVSLYHVYQALEEELTRHASVEPVALIHFPNELNRTEALIKDLQFYNGSDWASKLDVTPATRRYVEGIRDASERNPALLIAHSYTRYLGDLSGGQILGKKTQKSLNLPLDNTGIQFYTFSNIEDLNAFKNMYRERLDMVESDESLRNAIIAECIRSFEYNIGIFSEFDHTVKEESEEEKGLATALKQGTMAVHRLAENCDFIKRYMKGEVDTESYGKFLFSLYHVYKTLEEELRKNALNEHISLIHFPEELERTPAIIQDLEHFHGPNWKANSIPSPATQAYMDAIKKLSATDPVLLVAHSYTRYLGDLSGGQILLKKIQKSLNLPDDAGTRFYRFPRVNNMNDFKNFYRERLNAISVDQRTKNALVSEAGRAFELNIGIFSELDQVQESKSKSRMELGNVVLVLAWIVLIISYLYKFGYLSNLTSSAF